MRICNEKLIGNLVRDKLVSHTKNVGILKIKVNIFKPLVKKGR